MFTLQFYNPTIGTLDLLSSKAVISWRQPHIILRYNCFITRRTFLSYHGLFMSCVDALTIWAGPKAKVFVLLGNMCNLHLPVSCVLRKNRPASRVHDSIQTIQHLKGNFYLSHSLFLSLKSRTSWCLARREAARPCWLRPSPSASMFPSPSATAPLSPWRWVAGNS